MNTLKTKIKLENARKDEDNVQGVITGDHRRVSSDALDSRKKSNGRCGGGG